MSSVKKLLVVLVMLLTVSPGILYASYIPTGRDTQENPETLTDIPVTDFDAGGYAKLEENVNFTFYWQEARDVLVVYDKRNGYTWKTGLDVDSTVTRTTQSTVCKDLRTDYRNGSITYEEFTDGCETSVDTITGTTTGPLLANSLMYFEYYSKESGSATWASNTVFSSYLKTAMYDVDSTLQMVDGDASHWRFTFYTTGLGVDDDLDLLIPADILLSEDGFEIIVNNEDITGSCLPYLSAIGIATFMGAVGGIDSVFTTSDTDGETLANYDVTDVQRDMIGGYSFVPDGSGALIRFRDNSVSLTKYSATVYGTDNSQNIQLYLSQQGDYVPFKTASVPVYGIAHGNDQAAFVAYAESGGEYMSILSVPEENTYNYNYTHAKFSYNFSYKKIYTLDGDDPVPSIGDELNSFDIHMHYDFLAGDGSEDGYAADYVGMAMKYKDFLLDQQELAYEAATSDDIGIRLDFLMADSENSIVGYALDVVTTASDVEDILNDVLSLGIKNVSSGLLGWQDGGVTLGNPSKTAFTLAIGSKSAFANLIEDFADRGVDISFQQDYTTINEEQISLTRNAAKHPSGWYATVLSYEDPISLFYFARPTKSVIWLENQSSTFLRMGVSSLSIDGISNILITDYTGDGTSRSEAIALYRDALASLGEKVLINAVRPNAYLYPYVDRYLQMDVYSTQYLIETDTVPFLQLVLQGTMELYAAYSNFSFYTQSDILRMIDYNVWPSFILTKDAAYRLTDTNSSDYYSTEYALYRDLILSIYTQVNGILGTVTDARWVDRDVLVSGVIRNRYDDGTAIYINYTDEDYSVGGVTVPALSAVAVGGD
jgi:hypothetical protein